MNSSSVCSQCLRSLRRNANHTIQRSTRAQTRHITSSRQIFQQESAPDPRPYTAPPPITTGTVTANVTAVPPELTPTKPGSKSKIPEASTAEMQRQITSQLGRGRGASLTDSLAQKLRKTAPSATESYVTYGLTEAFFKSCTAQAPYTIPEEQRSRILTEKGPPKTAEGEDLGVPEESSASSFWFHDLGLPPTFSTWSQITYLHMYLLTVRLRTLDSSKQFRDYQRYLTEHFSHAAEDKMLLLHGMHARGIRNRYLKDLFVQWRGLLAAYDEGLVRGDAVLAGALWRNLWKGTEDVDWEKVAVVVAYVRRAVASLAAVPLDELVQNLDQGKNVWESSRTNVVSAVAQLRSKGITEPL